MSDKVNFVINEITNGLTSKNQTKFMDKNIGIMFQQTNGFKITNKLAMFDLDGTIIFNKSNNRFFKSKDDWSLLKNCKKRINKLHCDGYSIIIISNQTGLKNNINRYNMFCERLDNIIDELNVPLVFLAALSNNIFKKPSPAFFNKILLKVCKPAKVFYCGDAAGRDGDFSNSDLLFSVNCLINFYTPEQLFKLTNTNNTIPLILRKKLAFNSDKEFKYINKYKKELIIMFGYPASGKSTIANILSMYHNFALVSNDIHKNKFKKILCEKLSNNDMIVIDNTNLLKQNRKEIIDVANKFNYKIRCFVMKTSYEESIHNNYYRAYTSDRDLIPPIAYRFMKNTYTLPNKHEGINSIESVSHNFINTFEY